MDFEALSMEAARVRNEIDRVKGHSKLFNTENGEIFVLSYLYRTEAAVYPKMIALEMKISTARVAKLLLQLESKEMIERKPCELDRRQINVILLPKGKEKYLNFKKAYYLGYENILRALGPEDALEYVRIQKRILEIIND